MARARILAASIAAALGLLASIASAQLDDRLWNGGTGSQSWQINANWSPEPFPNDPGRVDPDQTVITDVVGANLSVDLPANLSVDVGATDVTVASLTIGGTLGAVTTNITSTGGRLVFENFELNNTMAEPDICSFNCSAALITSGGVAGSINTISALVGVNDQIDVTGTNAITFAGGLQEMGGADGNGNVSLRARLPGTSVLVTGNITTLNVPVMVGDGMEDIPLSLNSATDSQGTIEISGVISGAGRMRYGTAAQSGVLLPHGKVILRGANTYSGRSLLGRGTLVLGHNNALGTGVVKEEGSSEGSLQTGYNIESDNDDRVISNERIIGQWLTIKGEHSLEWAGRAYQDNRRGWINLLPAGKTFTVSGPQFPNHTEEMPPLPGRDISFDGSGRTVISGALHNELSTATETIDPGNYVGSFKFRGTGTTVLSSTASTYTGDTIIEGGNVHFATNAAMGNTTRVTSEAGAIGVDAGVIGNATFLGRLNNASNPVADAASNLTVYDRGGLMLAAGEYGQNLDFTGAMANAGSMSLAAHETGSTYTGTITPFMNTYRFGGGSGTLTLPNNNQLTQVDTPRNLVATNGGEVRITGTNNYTGTTSVIAKYITTLQAAAAADTPNFDDGDDIPNDQIYLGTTLTVNTLANGGTASSIGSATNAAGNLYLQGSTLKYVGGAANTDRLFTIGSGGATIDASGTGALSFTNTGSLGVDLAEQRTGNVNSFATGNTANDRGTVRNLSTTEDLRIGMPIMSPGQPTSGTAAGILPGAVITRIVSATEVAISMPVGEFAFYNNTPITFGPAPERTLTLTGSNTGNNTLASVIPDASDGGVVGLTKQGDGKWVLTGNNTYTGNTAVEDGILSITNPFLANAADVLMTSGGILDLSFVGTDVIDELFFNDAPQAAGTWGAIGNALATHQSAFFTGSGLLQVMTSNVMPVPGDYNNDGIVDGGDYVVWRNGGPLQNEGVTPGVVDVEDYNFWRARYGATTPASGAGHSTLASVPEPGTALAACMAVVVLIGSRRRRG